MSSTWTLARKMLVAFGVVGVIAFAMGLVAILGLRSVAAMKDDIIEYDAANLVDSARLDALANAKTVAIRSFMLVGDERFLTDRTEVATEMDRVLADLRQRLSDRNESHQIDVIQELENQLRAITQGILARRGSTTTDLMLAEFRNSAMPKRDAVDAAMKALLAGQKQNMETRREASKARAEMIENSVAFLMILGVLVTFLIGWVHTTRTNASMGDAVSRLQSSSAELETTATQQSSISQEHATSMSEITTTIRELLATSRQIADSAQRCARLSSEASDDSKTGDQRVTAAHDLFTRTRDQVGTIVEHMLDLQSKSQQVGGILDIINDMADQTNILAINATIEASSAGEHGNRFAVVADEIRKLSDRVAKSTRDIRHLLEGMKTATNRTLMVTETGAKTAQEGIARFAESLDTFHRIADLVATLHESSREIELSTQQQATAVDQVHLAVDEVARTAREVETSAAQSLQTSRDLAKLSSELSLTIRSPEHER